MNKALVFRLYSDEAQKILLAKTFGCCRFVYNRMLEEKMGQGPDVSSSRRITPAKYKAEHEWLKEVDSLALANEQLSLESAFRNYFRGGGFGYPKYKSKRDGRNSYTTNLVNGNIALADGKLRLPKLGKVSVRQHRLIPDGYRLKSVTVSLRPSGGYYASMLYEYEAEIEPVEPVNVLGLDYSMGELYVDSESRTPQYPRPYRAAQAKLARERRKLSGRKAGGKNYIKQKRKVARIHERAANQRKDFLHKQSRLIAKAYDAVCVEDLDMRGMAGGKGFGKGVSDNGWGAFRRMLSYKLEEGGKRLVVVDKWFPSSKKCSACGRVKEGLHISVRTFSCECGFVIDRDTNAAINIRNEGMRQLV